MSKHEVDNKESSTEKDKEIQEKLDAHAAQKMNKANENLILMTQNYNKYYFENTCECSSLSVPSKILNNAKTNWMSTEKRKLFFFLKISEKDKNKSKSFSY